MSQSTELIPVNTPEVEEIIEEMIENGGELTPDMEIRLQQISETGEGALEIVDRITDLLNYAFTSRMWIKARHISLKEREEIAGYLKASLPAIFSKDGGKGTMASPIKREDGTKITYVSASKKPGAVDIGNDPALEHSTTVSGYSIEDVERSEIPMSFFAPHTVYTPNLELIGQYLDQDQSVGLCKRRQPESYVRISHPRSLTAAADKIKRSDAKKARDERNKFGGK